MAVTVTNKLAAGAVNATSATTASVTPLPNRLYLLTVNSRTNISVDPNVPSITAFGLTWVQVATVQHDTTGASRKRSTMFRAMGTAPSAGTISIDFSGQTQTDIGWVLDEFSNVDASGSNGANAVVQSATNFDSTITVSTLTVTLGAFASANNATYGTFGIGSVSSTATAGSGFTIIGDVGTTTNNRLTSEFKNTNDTTVDMSFSGLEEIGGIAVEIKAAPILVTNVLLNQDVTGNTSYTTASITPATNTLYLLAVVSRTGISVDPNQPTVTGAGVTWVAISSIVYDTVSSSRRRVTLFRAVGPGSAGALTIDFGGQSQTMAIWAVDAVTGVDLTGSNGANAIVQSAASKDETGLTTFNTTLGAFSNVNNATYGASGYGDPAAGEAFTPGTGFNLLTGFDTNAQGAHIATEWRSDNSTTVDFTINPAPGEIGIIGVELKAATTSSLPPVARRYLQAVNRAGTY